MFLLSRVIVKMAREKRRNIKSLRVNPDLHKALCHDAVDNDQTIEELICERLTESLSPSQRANVNGCEKSNNDEDDEDD
jgi:hypothetical protein